MITKPSKVSIASNALIFLLLGGQVVWGVHQSARLKECDAIFNAAYECWQAAAEDDLAGRLEHMRRELICMAARKRVQAELLVVPWRWFTRWSADYLGEAEADVSPSSKDWGSGGFLTANRKGGLSDYH